MPRRHRRIFYLGLALVSSLTLIPKQAVCQGLGDQELLPTRLGPHPSHFVLVRGNDAPPEASFGLRAAWLDRPLSAVVPTPAKNGTRRAVLGGSLPLELTFHQKFESGFDFGINLGGSIHQWGEGLPLLSGDRAQIARQGTLDPIVEVGQSFRHHTLMGRVFSALYLPISTRRTFTGERRTRLEGGVHGQWVLKYFRLGLEASLLYRQAALLSTTYWGSQAKFAIAFETEVFAHFALGAELSLRPMLRTSAAHGAVQVPIPAETLMKLGYRLGLCSIQIAYGLGLPISRVSSRISQDRFARAPSAPAQHLLIDLRLPLPRKRVR